MERNGGLIGLAAWGVRGVILGDWERGDAGGSRWCGKVAGNDGQR